MQSILYTLQQQHLRIGDSYTANLLIPWKTVLPIKLFVESKETLIVNKQPIECFKIEFEIDLLIGQLLLMLLLV